MIAPREVIVIIVRPFTYDSDAHIISGRKNMIRIENLTPQLTTEECMEQRRCIEEGLFEVFIKYEKHNENDRQYEMTPSLVKRGFTCHT